MPISCPYCSGENSVVEIFTADYFLSGESFEIRHCPDCGLLYTDPAPAPEKIGNYYKSENYFSHNNASHSLMGTLYRFARKYTLARKYKFIRSLLSRRENRRILDIGCGTGHFLHTMKQHGWTVKGYEVSPDAIAFARAEFQLNVQPAQQLLKENEQFDIVTLWHVLEHVHDLKGYLKKFSELLSKEGRLVIALPNPVSYDAKHYGKFWGGYDVPRHLWHFTPDFIQHKLQDNGFELIGQETMLLDGFYVSMLSEQYQHHKWPMLKGGYVGLKTLFATLFLGKKHCSSLIYVFRKM